MTNPTPQRPDEKHDATPGTPGSSPAHNELTGDVHGTSVQAGAVTGGIHFHLVPSSSAAPRAAQDSGIRRTVRILRGWVLFLALLFVGSGFLSYFINISVGQGSLSRNLAADAALLLLLLTGFGARWKRTKATETSFPTYLAELLLRSTPKSLTSTSTPTLGTIAGIVIVFLLIFLITPDTSSGFTVAQGRNGVLIIFTALGCLVGNTLVNRWRNRPR